jgi:TRAP-type uncharacterized transport system fused permease subunit
VTKYREISSKFCWLLALAFAAFEFYTVGFEIMSPMSQRATMLAFSALLVFLLYPTANWTSRDDLPGPAKFSAFVWDYALISIAIWACGYIILNEAGLADRSGAETELDLITAAIGPIIVLDMVRRVAGWPLFFVALGTVVYAYWGDIVLVTLVARRRVRSCPALGRPKGGIGVGGNDHRGASFPGRSRLA